MSTNYNYASVTLLQVVELANAIFDRHDLDLMYENIYFHAADADNEAVARLFVGFEGCRVDVLDRSYFAVDGK